ncbi:MAG TPA: IMP dehydrogenase [Chroococcales cyanobacterium]
MIDTAHGHSLKEYRGMGALQHETNGRYGKSPGPLVPEGIEGRVLVRGSVEETLVQKDPE